IDVHTASDVGASGEHCLLLMDLRNAWPVSLTCSFCSHGEQLTKTTTIKPGQVVRKVLVIPKIYITNPHKRILSLSPTRNRQFVVSMDNISPGTERSVRELFWFREALLDTLEGVWKMESEQSSVTQGKIDLRHIRINPRMVEALRLPDIGISFHVDGSSLKQAADSVFAIPADEFVTLKTTL